MVSEQSTINGYVSVGLPTATTLGIGWQTASARNFYYQCRSMENLRGTNVVGMEILSSYAAIRPDGTSWSDDSSSSGPIAGQEYPVYDTRAIDFYVTAKRASVLRMFFSWEAMQSVLGGPIPAYPTGNYQDYFTNFQSLVNYATTTLGVRVIIEPWAGDPNGAVGGARYKGAFVGDPVQPPAAPPPTNDDFADMWSKMATKFAGNSLVWFGLMNEPNSRPTMQWFSAAQRAITAIRATGATQKILVPGNDWSRASSWGKTGYFGDSASPTSNADGFKTLVDPLSNLAAEVHQYLDANGTGNATDIISSTAARTLLSDPQGIMVEARKQGYQVFLGEIGFWQGATTTADHLPAQAAWNDFVSYLGDNSDTLIGYTWYAGGQPGYWPDVGASGGGHFSITPTVAPPVGGGPYSGDTVNMTMIGTFN
jgi:endoglucanase